MHEGVGLLHRGDSVPFCLNVDFDDRVFETRDGQTDIDNINDSIFSGKRVSDRVVVAAGTSVYVNEDVPALS